MPPFRLFPSHPPGLLICAATESWERFSYYGMRALLVFYLTQHFGFGDSDAFAIYGAYSALVYLAPILGGAVADRWLGGRKAVILGGILLVLGHFGMAFEGPTGQSPVYLNTFYFSLALIVAGVGFLKTSATAIVGALYEEHDPRRDAGYTYYYMLYNVGGAVAPVVCGWLGQQFGWRYGFGAAGVGMVIGLAIFLRGQHHLRGAAEPPDPSRLRRPMAGLPTETWIYIVSCLSAVVFWVLLLRREVVGPLLLVFGAGVGAWLTWYSLTRCTPAERRRLAACAVLVFFTIGFWAFYEQMGSSLALFSDRVVDRQFLGWEIPAATLQSLPSVFVILLAPAFAWLWSWLGRRNREPGHAVKFTIAIAILAAGFLVLVLGIAVTPAGEKVHLGWFVANFLLIVIGELCLAPVGLAMVSQLAPARIVSVMVGAFFLAYSASSFLAGVLARLTAAPPGAETADLTVMAARYGTVFQQLGLAAIVVAVVLAVLAPALGRAAATRDEPPPSTPPAPAAGPAQTA